MAVKLDPFAFFPAEISQEILLQLGDAREVGRCSTASALWNRTVDNDSLWKKLVPGISLPDRGVKTFIDRYAVNSLLSVSDRIEAFSRLVPWNHSGSFTCEFPFNPGSTVQVDIGVQGEGAYRERCIYMRVRHDPEGKTETFTTKPEYQNVTGCRIQVILPQIIGGNIRFFKEIASRAAAERVKHSHGNWYRIAAWAFGFLSLTWLSKGE